MSRFNPAPAYTHGSQPKLGILLINLGTPDAPTAPALRRYLKEFLSDPRVVEIPKPVWWPILHGVILNTRPARSAKLYRKIWMPEGSPLLVYSRRQADKFRARLAREEAMVELAMRYGSPDIPAALARLQAANCTRVLVFPLYPQYAASTGASAFDAISKVLTRTRRLPELRMIMHYHDHPAYIAALAASVREQWAAHGEPERLLMSFHGLPRRSLDLGDPYHCECQKTGRLLAEALELPPARYAVSFQSRFGRAEWLQPYTVPTLEAWAREGVRRVDVVCPGFAADCLETLEEIAIGGREAFLAAGGERFRYLPALNDRDDWIDAMLAIAREHLGGWLAPPLGAAALQASRERALGMGAER
ncbi:ferrochelatase [Thermithiobacillus tepidarius DSM 3134]|uniref:ferrochelatase n=1 Tax=Thermithiobacillus tepidarius TaxID=929 RepID=UPI000404F828|nr:ferrochelatase [Thermithiobacillus tepidarius]